jgi:TonB family protein
MSNPEDWKKWEGRVDGKFPLRQWLGGSDHSAVFLTERLGQSQKVAIKLIAADGAEADRQLARWRAAAQLSHPHLMRIFEAGRCRLDGTALLYLVMEYAEEDLAQILPQRPLAPAEVTDLLPALLDALSFLHGKGFVHSRVKPSNVHAMGDELKLSADQIMAGQVTSSTEANSAHRRRDVYDAPETAAGIVSPASDVWSIGVTLVAALTQNVSFEGDASQRDPDPPDTVPQPFRGIARECLHLDPKRRCSLAGIQARLQPAGRSVPAEPEPPALPPRPGKRGAVLVSATFLAAVVLIAFFVFHHRDHDRENNAPRPAASTAQPVPEAAPQVSPQSTPQTTTQPPPDAAAPASPNPPADQPIPPPKKAVVSRGEVVNQVLPDVPARARNSIDGTVKVGVRVEVDASGKVTAAALKFPGPSKYFASLALKAAHDWRFSPPEADGKPTASAWLIQFRFKRTSTQASPERVAR